MILIKTEAGQQVMKDRSVRLTPRQRSALILFDGKRSVADILGAGMGVAQEDIDQLVALDLLGRLPESPPAVRMPEEPPYVSAPPPASSTAASVVIAAAEPPSGRTPVERYQAAYPIATQLTTGLGLRGFRLNLAVEAAAGYEQLVALAPKIRAAVGPDKAAALERALAGRAAASESLL